MARKASQRSRGAARHPLEIWKFGGASLSDAAAVRRATTLIREHHGPLVVVVSAMAGVTDLLLDGARRSASGDLALGLEAAAEFRRKHRAVVAAVAPRNRRRQLLAIVDAAADEYCNLARAVSALRDLPERASDTMSARGERVTSAIVAAALVGVGRKSVAVDACQIVATDGRYGNATPDITMTRRRARGVLRPLLSKNTTAVVPGFIGATPDGGLATLGRGGSDLTATLLGRVLHAERVVLWKDVPGILTADPRLVPDARLIPQLHHREAAEVAYYGAKVLHPRALIPLADSSIVLNVRSFLSPERPGTEVSGRKTLPRYPVKALAIIKDQALVTVAGKGLMGVPGIAARAFEAVHAEGFSVSTIFQASSESSIGFTLAAREAAPAVTALKGAFRSELAAGLVDDVTAQPGMAVVAVVGNGMAGTPGIAARVFSALAAAGINVRAIAQGSSELNISFVVAEPDAAEAARRVHSAFQLAKIGGGRAPAEARTDVILLGFGKVGRALADQLGARNGRSPVRVVGLLDRSGYVFEPRGLSRRRLLELADAKDRGALLAQLGQRSSASAALTEIARHAVSHPLLIDMTADETGDLLLTALDHGFDLVLANKLPVAGRHERYLQLLARAQAARRRVRFETTVGAGLPIIDTFAKLVESGDRVLRIEGCVSGTLGYVLSAVSSGKAFSQAVREAMQLGLTEPDPREDLSGRDVARKGLILARLLGYSGPVPKAEDLTPKAMRRLPIKEFLARLETCDATWRERVLAAERRGRVLRYVVLSTPARVSAHLASVPRETPTGALQGTRNLVSFTTRRYRHEPLVIMGPGAGPEVTAAGILNDVHYLAATAS